MKVRLGYRATLLAVIGLGLVMPIAHADVIYDSRSNFQAATSGLDTITFEGIAPPVGSVSVSSPPGLTLDGVNFSIDRSNGSDGSLYVVGPDFYYPGNSVLTSQQATVYDNNITINLPSGVFALGLDYGSFFGGPLIFTFSEGTQLLRFAPDLNEGLSFVGIISTVAISSLNISADPSETLNIGNVSFGSSAPAAVPEPATHIPAGIAALFGLAILLHKHRRTT
jgi:hypothetical protein